MSDDINDLEHQKFIESTDVPGVKGIAIVNPDGSTITGGSGGSGNGAILDGVDTGIKASVLDYTNSNPLAVRLTDTNGDYIAAGAGTQYTEDAASPSDPIGTQIIARRRDSLSAETSADGDNTALNSTSKGELYVKHIDDIPVTNAGITTIAGAVSGTEMQVDVVTSALPTGASTSAKQDTIIGHVDGIETILGTIDTDTGNIATSTSSLDTKVGEVQATPTANTILARLKTIADNQLPDSHNVTVDNASIAVTNAGITTIAGAVSGSEMQVDVVSSALPVGAATAAKQPALGTAGTASSDVLTVQGIASMTALKVDGSAVTQPVSGTITAVTSITNALPAGDNNIGNVDLASSIPAGTNNIGDVDVLTLPSLVAGTAEIGSLLPPDTDVTAHTNYARKYYTNTGAVTDGIIWSPAAGKRWHVVTMYIQTSAASTITLEDDKAGGDDPVWKGEIAANSGVTLSFTEQYPMASGEDAADLIITTTAGNVYVTVVGYEI